MKSVEFNAAIVDGIINIPNQYREFLVSVKVILMENTKKPDVIN